jgi:transcriptional regulator with XRE-family HTH domain
MGTFSEQLQVAIQEAIWECGLSQAELARRTELSEGQISRFRRGERNLSLDSIDKLVDVLGLEIVIRPRRKRKDG